MLYGELASWWPILSDPADYAEEAAFAATILAAACETPPLAVLELGSGGGNNASHLKVGFRMTLVDLSHGMLDVSRRLNPECEHVLGDMRSVRLQRGFDAVFVHDAIMYMTTASDLRAALETAAVHCRPGGAALFMPDHVRETFASTTKMGGHERGGRELRYLQWMHEPEPGGTTFVTDFAVFLREEEGPVRLVHDRHVMGLFPRATWLDLMRDVGFEPSVCMVPDGREAMMGVKAQRTG